MRRGGRILLFLVVVIVILIAVTVLVLGSGQLKLGTSAATATPANVKIYVVGQPINRNDEIKPESLSTIDLPENLVHEWMIRDPQQVVGKFAAFPLKQGLLLSLDVVTERPGMLGLGSEAAKVISPGLVAISMPISRLSAVAYGIRDGDRVNVIATTMFVDLDASFQSILPNDLGQVTGPGDSQGSSLVAGGSGKYGRIDLDPTINQAIYVVPHEDQRPRLVSQMVLQDIQVLHVGTFSLVPEGDAQPTPEGGAAQPAATAVPVANPDIITLIVTPQDAVSLTYMLTSGVNLTLTLRAPDDSTRAETEAATLQYLLSQYAIPVPAKLPYGIQPRLDNLPPWILAAGTPAAPAP
jgi:Flp pilus assembly protein CpaB